MMIDRIFNIPKSLSFFVFGARGTGKSTLLKAVFEGVSSQWFDLLDPNLESRLSLDPMLLERECLAQSPCPEWIVIDEVQKIPALLDVVHRLIENHGFRFALTGSSARKLRRGSANMLAGRALQKPLFPMTHREVGEGFDLHEALNWGTMPQVFSLDDSERRSYLNSYVSTYIREEIQIEQIVRKLPPFRRFLQVAAQTSGQIVNYSNIAKDVGSDPVSVQSYFQILEDTHMGMLLEPFHESIRKRQRRNPKFYFFDIGVRRALANLLDIPVTPATRDYGEQFEHFVILEISRLIAYQEKSWTLSYLRTGSDAEIDLVIERPGMTRVLVEIKSKTQVQPKDLRHLVSLGKDVPNAQSMCFSNDTTRQEIDGVLCLPWYEGIREIGL